MMVINIKTRKVQVPLKVYSILGGQVTAKLTSDIADKAIAA